MLTDFNKYLCRYYLPLVMVYVCRYIGLLRMENRKTGNRPDILFFIHVSKVRMDYRRCFDRMATGLFRLQSKCNPVRLCPNRHLYDDEYFPGHCYHAISILHFTLSAKWKKIIWDINGTRRKKKKINSSLINESIWLIFQFGPICIYYLVQPYSHVRLKS